MRGSCHCGTVRIEVARPPEWIGSCNCSLCLKLASLMAYYHPDEVAIAPAGGTDIYIWGDRCIELHHCRTCGCFTHWASLTAGADRMGINMRLFDGLELDKVELRRLDGASF
jgi:hypothetical protein